MYPPCYMYFGMLNVIRLATCNLRYFMWSVLLHVIIKQNLYYCCSFLGDYEKLFVKITNSVPTFTQAIETVIQNVTLGECARQCILTSDFLCGSFAYSHIADGICALSDRFATSSNQLRYSNLYSYYHYSDQGKQGYDIIIAFWWGKWVIRSTEENRNRQKMLCIEILQQLKSLNVSFDKFRSENVTSCNKRRFTLTTDQMNTSNQTGDRSTDWLIYRLVKSFSLLSRRHQG